MIAANTGSSAFADDDNVLVIARHGFGQFVVILGGIGSLLGAFIGSFIVGFIYTFGTALFPELAYIILFLPMIVVLAFRPQGLLGRLGA